MSQAGNSRYTRAHHAVSQHVQRVKDLAAEISGICAQARHQMQAQQHEAAANILKGAASKSSRATRSAQTAHDTLTNTWPGLIESASTPAEKNRRQRDQEQMLSELQHATRALQNAVRQSESIEGQAREGLGAHTRVNMSQAQLQAQPLLHEHEIAHNEGLIAEREAGVQQLTRDLQILHESMADLAELTQDQGEMLVNVEDNTQSAAHRAGEGVKHLEAAERMAGTHRKKLRWLLFCVALVAIGVTGVVIYEYAR